MVCVICQDVEAEQGYVCDRDRVRLARTLDDVYDLSLDLPDNLARTGASGPKVTGSREAPLPLNVDVLDLGLPARTRTVTDPHLPRTITRAVTAKVIRTVWHRGIPLHPDFWTTGIPQVVEEAVNAGQRFTDGTAPAGDQIGHISVAAVLDSWAVWWVAARNRGERMPVPTVAALHGWLRERLGWACDEFEGVDGFDAELRHLRGALRGVLNLVEPRPQLMDQPCPGCGYLTLIRRPGENLIDCDREQCKRVYTLDEYAAWLRPIADLTRERMAA